MGITVIDQCQIYVNTSSFGKDRDGTNFIFTCTEIYSCICTLMAYAECISLQLSFVTKLIIKATIAYLQTKSNWLCTIKAQKLNFNY